MELDNAVRSWGGEMRKIAKPKYGEIGIPERIIKIPKPIPVSPISPMKRPERKPAPEPGVPEKIPVKKEIKGGRRW